MTQDVLSLNDLQLFVLIFLVIHNHAQWGERAEVHRKDQPHWGSLCASKRGQIQDARMPRSLWNGVCWDQNSLKQRTGPQHCTLIRLSTELLFIVEVVPCWNMIISINYSQFGFLYLFTEEAFFFNEPELCMFTHICINNLKCCK